jgi:natural product precursor
MKTVTIKKTKSKSISFSCFSKLNVSELMKLRGGDTTTGESGKKFPD